MGKVTPPRSAATSSGAAMVSSMVAVCDAGSRAVPMASAPDYAVSDFFTPGRPVRSTAMSNQWPNGPTSISK